MKILRDAEDGVPYSPFFQARQKNFSPAPVDRKFYEIDARGQGVIRSQKKDFDGFSGRLIMLPNDFLQARFVIACGLSAQLPPPEAGEMVCCGRSNVGKSSLINRLCNQKALARVSSEPGKTSTVNFFSVGDAMLVDLPGYGYAKRSRDDKARWSRLLEHYFNSGRPIRLVLLLLDCRHAPSADDLTMLAFLRDTGLPFWAVLTKTDKLSKTKLTEREAYFAETLTPFGVQDIIPFTTQNTRDAEMLREKIAETML